MRASSSPSSMGVTTSPGTQTRTTAPGPFAEGSAIPAEDNFPMSGEDPQEESLSEFCVEEDEEGEEDELFYSELSSEGSVDYGFIAAVSCLVTGISLVAISYVVPRDMRGPEKEDGVAAREMERLQRERARLGAHLDRCVIAGLCLLTLGGVLLSSLLMVSMWKGETMRRRALAHAAKSQHNLYGAIGWGHSDPAGTAFAAPADDSAEF
ncbi:transmembrane protein 74 [Syngnathus scovelli]|uniref:transmembrane protein 74 n=1 Tax=Syngnathus scovelli TaxID=161590 RepID=UPI0021107670|nr:transmembrane protein 74 [Syngnathus scovelli]